jgi:hypothetical protein
MLRFSIFLLLLVAVFSACTHLRVIAPEPLMSVETTLNTVIHDAVGWDHRTAELDAIYLQAGDDLVLCDRAEERRSCIPVVLAPGYRSCTERGVLRQLDRVRVHTMALKLPSGHLLRSASTPARVVGFLQRIACPEELDSDAAAEPPHVADLNNVETDMSDFGWQLSKRDCAPESFVVLCVESLGPTDYSEDGILVLH